MGVCEMNAGSARGFFARRLRLARQLVPVCIAMTCTHVFSCEGAPHAFSPSPGCAGPAGWAGSSIGNLRPLIVRPLRLRGGFEVAKMQSDYLREVMEVPAVDPKTNLPG